MAHGAEPGADPGYDARAEQAHNAMEADRAYEAIQLEELKSVRTQRDELVEALHQAVAAMWSGDSAEKGRAAVLARVAIKAAGMARLQHDVVTLPADQQALGLVEAILEQATLTGEQTSHPLAYLALRLATIQGDAERLKVLLEKGDEGNAALRDLLSGQAVDIAEREVAVRELRAEKAALLEALKDAVGAFEYQVTLCHARDAALLDKDIWARPMDYQEVVANMYAATAEPLTKARAAIGAAS